MKLAWAEGLASRDLFFAAVALDPVGAIRNNAATFSAAVTDLKHRYGVERVNVVGYCKGGINAREHAHRNPDDIDQLIMLATPNAGSFRVESV
ncbi:MAG TPA: alpha/beta hydrolase, partial [Streptosporangiaceae bacterium]|nr:alpha/beta hydrolase [Streptosporangiaceae bacterium]